MKEAAGFTVRADGKRTASTETFSIDENEDGEQTANELKANSYSWSYDGLNRLTAETIDHWDNAFDQTESYDYDIVGNRTSVARLSEAVSDPTTLIDDDYDEVTSYKYDDNDRLYAELANDQTSENADKTTIYGFDHTQQTAKTVYTDLLSESVIDDIVEDGDDSVQQRVSAQTFIYNLQGRMSEAVVDKYNADGTLDTREKSSYEYDMRSFRVGQTAETWNKDTGEFEFKSDTEFLVSHRNHTGYAQTLRETTTNADGSTKTIDYTFGADEIAQRVVERDDQGTITSDQTHVFGHDGHGSVRVLYDLAATTGSLIAQIVTYSSYGVQIAMHSGDGVVADTALSSLGYSGEHFDASIQKSFNRARWYDANNGQWNRLDPFSGNNHDPQSLHKYAYVHGDPIGGVDPTGLAIEPYNNHDALSLSQLGTLAHQQFTNFAAENFGILNAGQPLSNVLPTHFSSSDPGYDLKPDLVRPTQQDFFELKPITHRNSPSHQLNDFSTQIGFYDSYLNPKGFFRGSSAQVIPHQVGGYLVGYVTTLSKHYRMIAYPEHRFRFTESNLPSRGLLYYELIEEKRNDDNPLPFIVTRHKNSFKEDRHDQNRDIKFYTVRKQEQKLVQDIDISIAARNIALAGAGLLAVRGASAVGAGLGSQFAARMSLAISFRFG